MSTSERLARHVRELLGVELAVTPTPEGADGDYGIACFPLAKIQRRSPGSAANDLAARLDGWEGARATATGPYVNLSLDLGRAAAPLVGALLRPSPPPPAHGVVMVEFSQPNTHKEMHVGHLRNAVLGDTLVRLLRDGGREVLAANYYGDEGAHIARCRWWIEESGSPPPAEGRGEWLGAMYAAGSKALHEAEAAARGGDPAATARVAAIRARVGAILAALEQRELTLTAWWEETRAWSLEAFRAVYAWCDVRFDREFYESEVSEAGLALVKEYLDRGLFVVSDGAVGVVNPEIAHMPFFLLRRSDGTGLYSTKDLALARLKFEQYAIDQSIYVVDVRQSDHFRHVFRTLERMGFEQAARCVHVPYEMVELPDGPMSSRDGRIVTIAAARARMEAHIRARYLGEGARPSAEEEEIAREVALGALRYGMLAADVGQRVVFDLERWLNLDGNTGPYLQYTAVRLRSILARNATVGVSVRLDDAEGLAADLAAVIDPDARALVLALEAWMEARERARVALRPAILCRASYQLARAYGRWNRHASVLHSEGALQRGRWALTAATEAAISRGLSLLGIPIPARM